MKTARLILAKPALEDVTTYFEIYGDIRTNLYNPFGPVPDITAAKANMRKFTTHWEQYGFGPWKISLESKPEEIIGYGGLSHKMYGDVDRINVGYRFAESAWGKGYATEFCKAAIQYGFEELNFPEIYAVVRPVNLASIKVLEKSDMVLNGELDDVPGQVKSLVYYIRKADPYAL
ncbi:MAG: GNAT family N-acetyltransferase [Chitinophaga sp.]|uniref:GNAT family N-acetyltransferase n=1 Tax=Chitinophaga sp. TaxID=1869181 RepID=UPI001B069EB8|nr:GNAT family N-acetyltransferase [Chitinophaga sp.]MBO9728215.1 GNAT family N-acetyltransferase [Chitinophaga sp.]